MSLLYVYTTEREDKGGERRPKARGEDKVTLWITLFVFTIIIEKYISFKGLCRKQI
jgi:hypothetical protein